jgi:hypothetical protein
MSYGLVMRPQLDRLGPQSLLKAGARVVDGSVLKSSESSSHLATKIIDRKSHLPAARLSSSSSTPHCGQ